ncbi:hypothetical protein PGC35_19970 [Psychrobacillus sp. PGGUH221]
MDSNKKEEANQLIEALMKKMPREKVMDTSNQLHMPNKALMSWRNIATC